MGTDGEGFMRWRDVSEEDEDEPKKTLLNSEAINPAVYV